MIKAWRLELGETQEEFGRRWGLGKSVVSMYELGNTRPSLDTMRQWLQEGGEKGLEIANQMLYE